MYIIWWIWRHVNTCEAITITLLSLHLLILCVPRTQRHLSCEVSNLLFLSSWWETILYKAICVIWYPALPWLSDHSNKGDKQERSQPDKKVPRHLCTLSRVSIWIIPTFKRSRYVHLSFIIVNAMIVDSGWTENH